MNHENPLTIFRDCLLCSLMLLGSPFHRNSAYLSPRSGHGNFVCSIEKMLIIFWIEFNILFGDCSSFLRKFRLNLQRLCFHAWWYWYWYWWWTYEYQFTIIEMTVKWANERVWIYPFAFPFPLQFLWVLVLCLSKMQCKQRNWMLSESESTLCVISVLLQCFAQNKFVIYSVLYSIPFTKHKWNSK